MAVTDRQYRYLVILGVMTAAVMQVLDITIVNVALPHMMGSLGATPDQITWVLTSYMVASVVIMPTMGFLTARFGRKRVLVISITGFIVASCLCGLAQNLFQVVLFRLLQGMFGAALAPLSQAIMVDIYPPEERGKAMAIWSMGVVMGPILGPTLGGYLTQVLSWRWVFYVNLPVGIFSLLLCLLAVHDTQQNQNNKPFDWKGFTLLALGIGALQYVLDRGNQEDWFGSHVIQVMTLLSVIGLVGFAIYGITHSRECFVNLRLFKDRNFAIANILIAALGLAFYGTLFVQPLLLISILNYPTFDAGLAMAPRGIAAMIGMMIVGRVIQRIEPRLIALAGLSIAAIGVYVTTFYSVTIDMWWATWPGIVQGLGIGMALVPISTIAFKTLPRESSSEGAGLFSLMRVMGGSIGIAIAGTILSRHTQIAWNHLAGHFDLYNPALNRHLSALHQNLSESQVMANLNRELERQAFVLGIVDVFILITWSLIIMLPMVLAVSSSKRTKPQ
ncbi:MAG: DHA2 family efflux MFS transporter permease subunit [Gammaproteobacteria bacterium]